MTAARPLLCIYHGNCADGFGAAWVVRQRCRLSAIQVDFHAGVYQDPPPDVSGRDVLLVDFSYKRPLLLEMAKTARSIVILDHHKTAAEDLAGFQQPAPFAEWDSAGPLVREGDPPIAALFDLERSGAGLAWDFFFSEGKRPALIDHIEDRDLWRFVLPHTREIQAALFSYPYDFAVWDKLFEAAEHEPMFLAKEGQAIERKHHKDIAELVAVVTRPMRFRYPPLDGPAAPDLGFIVVPMANLPYTLTSDAGHLLCSRSLQGTEPTPQPDDVYLNSIHPFAGCYWDTPNGRVFSLRSREDGADVGAIAKQYGGGGHKHASGFRVPYSELGQFEVNQEHP